jgi:hypothetical protein
MAASPVDEHLATLGKDGRLFIYNYLEKKLLLVKRFPAEGSCLLWLPLDVSDVFYMCRNRQFYFFHKKRNTREGIIKLHMTNRVKISQVMEPGHTLMRSM